MAHTWEPPLNLYNWSGPQEKFEIEGGGGWVFSWHLVSEHCEIGRLISA